MDPAVVVAQEAVDKTGRRGRRELGIRQRPERAFGGRRRCS